VSAEVLREAAALMRSRAEAASDGPWTNRRGPAEHVIDDWDVPIATVDTRENRRYIASWHPAVALAVADWLKSEASAHSGEFWTDTRSEACCRMEQALAVARAYLGTTP
jgi:hypothetical protein